MPSLASAVTNFFQSIVGILASLANSILAVFQSILALAQNILGGVLQLAQSLISLVFELFQGVTGFLLSNIIVLSVVGVGYYLYINYQKGSNRKIRK